MNGVEEEDPIVYEIAVVVPRRNLKLENEGYDCVEVLVNEFRNVGFVVERVFGLHDEFIKLAAPLETLGRVAARLNMKKTTHIGIDLQFEWEEIEAFVRQSDGSLFSWCERFQCYRHLIHETAFIGRQ